MGKIVHLWDKCKETNVFSRKTIVLEIHATIGQKIPTFWLKKTNYSMLDHSVVKRDILSHWKKISSNQLFSKTIAFTKILSKKSEREFP